MPLPFRQTAAYGKRNPTPDDLPEDLRVAQEDIEPLRSIYCWDMASYGVAKYGNEYFWFSFYCGKADFSASYYLLHPIPITEVDSLLAWYAQYEAKRTKDGAPGSLGVTVELGKEFRAWRGAQTDYDDRPWTYWFSTAKNSRKWWRTENA